MVRGKKKRNNCCINAYQGIRGDKQWAVKHVTCIIHIMHNVSVFGIIISVAGRWRAVIRILWRWFRNFIFWIFTFQRDLVQGAITSIAGFWIIIVCCAVIIWLCPPASGSSLLGLARLLALLKEALSAWASTSSFCMEVKHSWWAFAMSSFALDVYSTAFCMKSWACLVLSSNAFKMLSASDFLLLPTTSTMLWPKELLKLGYRYMGGGSALAAAWPPGASEVPAPLLGATGAGREEAANGATGGTP